MFWSGEKLTANLSQLIFNDSGAPIGDSQQIDCAAYPLTIGPEAFITPTESSKKKKGHTKILLNQKENFVLPKGQFAFLLSEEIVHIPDDAIGWISFKTKSMKFKGLVNVSGFHVDPGYKGRLVFSLFNAGPLDITLKRGQSFALLWLADLDQKTSKIYQPGKSGPHNLELDTDIVGPLNNVVYSPGALNDRIKDLEKKVDASELQIKIWFLAIVAAIVIGSILNLTNGGLNYYLKRVFSPDTCCNIAVNTTSKMQTAETNKKQSPKSVEEKKVPSNR